MYVKTLNSEETNQLQGDFRVGIEGALHDLTVKAVGVIMTQVCVAEGNKGIGERSLFSCQDTLRYEMGVGI